MATKITFKINRPTGRFSWTSNPYWDVKIKKVKIMSIHKKSHLDNSDKKDFYISLRVEEENPENCRWKGVNLVSRFDTIEEAKDFLIRRIDDILAKNKVWNVETDELFKL